MAEWQKSGHIRLARFWARRARRLLPALLVLLLFVVGYVALFSAPDMYPGLRGDALSSLFYVANWHFIVEGSNYFAQTGATSPLLHTWSLAVEEQFYLVWPIVVLLVLQYTVRTSSPPRGQRRRGSGICRRNGTPLLAHE